MKIFQMSPLFEKLKIFWRAPKTKERKVVPIEKKIMLLIPNKLIKKNRMSLLKEMSRIFLFFWRAPKIKIK